MKTQLNQTNVLRAFIFIFCCSFSLGNKEFLTKQNTVVINNPQNVFQGFVNQQNNNHLQNQFVITFYIFKFANKTATQNEMKRKQKM